MTWFIAGLFLIAAYLNRKDTVKFYTAITFAIIHLFNCVITFEYFNFFYANIFASLSLMLYPSLASQKDWAWCLGIILASCICADFLGIINLQLWESVQIGGLIDTFKYFITTVELVVLVLMANGRLNRYSINDFKDSGEYSFRDLFARTNNLTYLERKI